MRCSKSSLQEAKQKEYDEWQTDRKQELREQYHGRQKRRDRWELWAAANPKAAKSYTTNYEVRCPPGTMMRDDDHLCA